MDLKSVLYCIGEAILLEAQGVKEIFYISEDIYPYKIIVTFNDGKQYTVTIAERKELTFSDT